MKKWLMLAALWMALIGMAHAQFGTPPVAERESGVQQIQFIKTGEVLYNIRWTATKFEKNGKTFVKFEARGDNAKHGSERIEWTEEALWELTPDGIRSIFWEKKSTGAERMRWRLDYDWNARKVHYLWSDAMTGKREEKTLELGENAVAGDVLYIALRNFPFEKGEGYRYKAQIVMSNGTIISGYIIHRGEEKLKTAFGKLDTYKLELKPTGVIGVVAPKMYIWFTKTAPHIWLRFDGKDEGIHRPRTKNILLQYEPHEWIKPGK